MPDSPSSAPTVWTPAMRHYVMAMIALVGVFNFADRQVLAILLESIRKDVHATDTEMGLLTGVSFAIFYTLAGIPLARAADVGIRRNIISYCVGLWSLMTALSGVANSYIHLALARIGVAIGESGAIPVSQSMIADIYPPTSRARAQGVMQGAQCVGIAAGMFLGGWLNHLYGWRAVFLIIGLPGLLVAVLFRLTVREPIRGMSDPGHIARIEPESFVDGMKAILRQRSTVLILLGLGLNAFTGYGALNWGPAFVIRTHHLDSTTAGFWMGLTIVGGLLVGSILTGILADILYKRDERWSPFLSGLGALLTVPCIILFAMTRSTTIAIVAFFLFNFVASLIQAPAYSLLQTLNRPHRRAMVTFYGTLITNLLGTAAGPLFVGIVSDGLRPTYRDGGLAIGLALVPIGAVIASVLFFLSMRGLKRDLAV